MHIASRPELLLQRGVSDVFWRAFRTYYNSDKNKDEYRILRKKFCLWSQLPTSGGLASLNASHYLDALLVHLAGTGEPVPWGITSEITTMRDACKTLLDSQTLGPVIYTRLEAAYKARVNGYRLPAAANTVLRSSAPTSSGAPSSTLEVPTAVSRARKHTLYLWPMTTTCPPPMDEDAVPFAAPGMNASTDPALHTKPSSSSRTPSPMPLEGSTPSSPNRRPNRYRSPIPTASLPPMNENALSMPESGVTASDENPTPYPTEKLTARVDELLKQLDRVQALEADLATEHQRRTDGEAIAVSQKAMQNALEVERQRANAAEVMVVNQVAMQNALEAERQRADAAEAMIVNQVAMQNALEAERQRANAAETMFVDQVRRANAAEAMVVNHVAFQNALEAEHQRANVAEAKVNKMARQLDQATACAFVQRAWIYEWPQFSAIGPDMVVITLACGPCVGVYKQWTVSQTTHVMVGVVKAIRDVCVSDFAAAVAQGLRNSGRATEGRESKAAIDQAALEAARLLLSKKVGVLLEHVTEDQVLARVQDLVAAATLHESSWVHCQPELIQLLDRYCALRSSMPPAPRDIELWDQKVVTPLDMDGRWRHITRAAGL